jgi:hypothetical protein
VRVVRPHWAILPPLLYLALVVVGFPALTMLNYSPLSLGFGLAALLFLLRYIDGARIVDGIAVGLLLCACALTKQNFGALVLIAVAIGFLWGRPGSALHRRSVTISVLPVLASGGVLALAALGYLALLGTLPDLIDQTVFSLGGSQLQSFNNPIPPLFGPHPSGDGRFIFLYSPPTLFNYLMHGEPILGRPISPLMIELAIRLSYGVPLALLIAGPILLWMTRHSDTPEKRRAARAIVVFTLLVFLGIFPSAIWSHLAFVAAPIPLVLALLGDRSEAALARRSRAAVLVLRGVLAAVLVMSVIVAVRISTDIRRWYPVPIDLPRASLTVSEDQAALFHGAIRFIEECSNPGDSIFVAPDMPVLYFLTERRNPTPYGLTIPGNVDGHLIIERLETEQTRCIVYNPRMYLEFPPFKELFPDVARYLSTRFTSVEEIRGGGTVWYGLVRRPDPSH